MEVPEIYERIVKIVSAAREPGSRAKIAVVSNDPNVDPVGACVGMKGSRVQSVVNELRGEKIDIVPYSENPAKFVCNALAPADITKVIIDEENHSMQIIVGDDQLSLAIGKKGQNVRLAVQISTWRLDIHSETKLKEIEDGARRIFMRIPQIPEDSRELIIKTGYTTLEDLADTEVEDLVDFPGIDEQIAEEIIEITNHILDTDDWPLPPVEEPDEPRKEVFQGKGKELHRSEALAAAESLFASKTDSPEEEQADFSEEEDQPEVDQDVEVNEKEEEGEEIVEGKEAPEIKEEPEEKADEEGKESQ